MYYSLYHFLLKDILTKKLSRLLAKIYNGSNNNYEGKGNINDVGGEPGNGTPGQLAILSTSKDSSSNDGKDD